MLQLPRGRESKSVVLITGGAFAYEKCVERAESAQYWWAILQLMKLICHRPIQELLRAHQKPHCHVT